MRKTVAAVVAAGSLLAGALLVGLATATPALAQARPITLLCSPASNGGTLVNGVCVLPAAAAGQPYEAFLLTSNGAVDRGGDRARGLIGEHCRGAPDLARGPGRRHAA